MRAAYLPNRSNPKSLTAKIRDAERQVLNRQRGVGVRAATLARKIQQQMTAPASLLLASGVGFIIGELTKRQTPLFLGAADKPRAAETTPLSTALNLMSAAHTLYTGLVPLAWMMKSFHQPGASGPATERQYHPVADSGEATDSQGNN